MQNDLEIKTMTEEDTEYHITNFSYVDTLSIISYRFYCIVLVKVIPLGPIVVL